MSLEELYFLNIGKLSEIIKRKEVSPVEVTRSYLERIETVDRHIKAYITVLEDEAMEISKEVEKAILAGNYIGPLQGIPIAHKDVFFTQGVRTTGGSKIFDNFIPQYDAAVVEHLRKAGAIMLGKLNTHEFALGVTTQNLYCDTRNPWNLERIPGGSSGGSGAAVAAFLCAGATGNDGGGSIRIPSSICGIVGIKPTFGRVSNFGGFPWVGLWSVCHSGPMTRSVEDAALMLQVLAGYDPRDPSSRDVPVPNYTKKLNRGVKGLKLGVPKDYFFERLDGEVKEAVEKATRVFEDLGASLEEVCIPHIRYAYPALLALLSEAGSAHDTLIRTKQPREFGSDVRQIALLGHFISAADYIKAQRVRRILMGEMEEIFKKVDAILTPTLPLTAAKVGQTTVKFGEREENYLDAIFRFTLPFNLTGSPAITVPCGFTSSSLPIGLQIVGKAFDEATIIRVAHTYEVNTSWHERRPSI